MFFPPPAGVSSSHFVNRLYSSALPPSGSTHGWSLPPRLLKTHGSRALARHSVMLSGGAFTSRANRSNQPRARFTGHGFRLSIVMLTWRSRWRRHMQVLHKSSRASASLSHTSSQSIGAGSKSRLPQPSHLRSSLMLAPRALRRGAVLSNLSIHARERRRGSDAM